MIEGIFLNSVILESLGVWFIDSNGPRSTYRVDEENVGFLYGFLERDP